MVVEGAGSPAEINLADGEIVNMRVARLADAPVLLVGDIDLGGVFAAFVGTLALLPPEDRRRVRGFIVNRSRGDAALLAPGLEALAARTGVPVLGVVPHLGEPLVAAEDSLDLDLGAPGEPGERARLEVAVARLPRLANFDDLEPLRREPGVRVTFLAAAGALAGADLVVLPGSKATVLDLDWLRARGLAAAVAAAAAAGTPVLGICGGYQMLGRSLHDPDGVESSTTDAAGLGLLPVTTTFRRTKTTRRVRARVEARVGLLGGAAGREVAAYEIHAGVSGVTGAACAFTVVERGGRPATDPDGAVSADGAVVGTYLHGVLADDAVRGALLRFLAERRGVAPDARWGTPRPAAERYDRLADAVAAAVDIGPIAARAGL